MTKIYDFSSDGIRMLRVFNIMCIGDSPKINKTNPKNNTKLIIKSIFFLFKSGYKKYKR